MIEILEIVFDQVKKIIRKAAEDRVKTVFCQILKTKHG